MVKLDATHMGGGVLLSMGSFEHLLACLDNQIGLGLSLTLRLIKYLKDVLLLLRVRGRST